MRGVVAERGATVEAEQSARGSLRWTPRGSKPTKSQLVPITVYGVKRGPEIGPGSVRP